MRRVQWDKEWNLWMIDHTRAFGRDAKVRTPENVQMCSRGLYDAIKGLDSKALKTAMKPYMSSFELSALVKRHKDLIKLLDGMIQDQGEDQVIFEYE